MPDTKPFLINIEFLWVYVHRQSKSNSDADTFIFWTFRAEAVVSQGSGGHVVVVAAVAVVVEEGVGGHVLKRWPLALMPF